MKSKLFQILSVILIAAFALAACAPAATTVAPTTAAPAATSKPAAVKKTIGFSVYDMQYGFFQDMEKGTKEAVLASGNDYLLVDQKSSESTMVSATTDMLNQGIGALIISPIKPDAMGPIVDAAKAKGIPVNYQTLVEDLCWWGERVRIRWAQAFWGAGAEEPVATQEAV